ncbi:MAG: Hsp20 family protein [Hyphomicrobiales bacterium]|nr:Hsp20 family protein [Hyphomicrobiales bacterium]
MTTRLPILGSPLLLGFDGVAQALDKLSKSAGEGYPPYNIERLETEGDDAERLRITLAVAGFSVEQLDISQEANQLIIRGKQTDENARVFLHRGIAARSFHRAFVLADGVEVVTAGLESGLLTIDLIRREPPRVVRTIKIVQKHRD